MHLSPLLFAPSNNHSHSRWWVLNIAPIVLLLASLAGAQQSPTSFTPDTITGFESLGTWNVSGNSSPPGFMVASTANRTQGSAAYAISNPPNMTKVISQPIASTATALTGIGNQGAVLELDVLIPVQQGNMVNSGYIQPYISSPSRGLSKVALTQTSFSKYVPGIYNTFGFAIPGSVSSALKGASYKDLTVEFDISSPGKITGSYMIDNLRVHSVPLVQSPTGTPPPPGYGGSVNLVVYGDLPVSGSYNVSPTQIPKNFHLKLGSTGATTVQLKLGLDKSPAFSCSYTPDPSDNTDRTYVFTSCTKPFHAGDLVNANWVYLGIVGGDHSQKIRAQISLTPLGDVTGPGLIPPMPTFWGDADSCTPAPVSGQTVTFSQSCSDQVSLANQIITDYFNEVNNASPSPNWVVPPVPEFAMRKGDGSPNNNLIGPPPSGSDPPFDDSGHLNSGGTFDAYWHLNGTLNPTAVANTDENKTHFDATFSTHAVLFGEDVDVFDATLTGDTDSGETTPTYKAATSSGNLGFYVFGQELPSGGYSADPGVNFTYDPSINQDFNLPPIQIWIFDITLGATLSADLNASGSAALSGADLSVTPTAKLGGHAQGGINIGVANGGLDTRVDLMSVSAPVTAQAKWVLDTSPKICAAELNGALKGDITLASGGGEIDLDATFGVCPFCYTDSETLFKWGPLASNSWNLFNDTIDTTLFGLPGSLCTFPVTVNIVSPTSGASLSSGLPISLSGSAKPNDSTIASTSVYHWTYTPGANASSATVDPTTANGANPNVTFGAPTSGSSSTWTIGLSADVTVSSAGGTQVTSTASATPVTITVTNLSSGIYISQVSSVYNGIAVPDGNGVLQVGNVPGTITVSGLVNGASGTLNTTFTIAQCTDGDSAGYTATCSSTGPATALTTTNASTTTPSATFSGFDGFTYKITMTTTQNGSSFGTTSVLIWGTELL